VPLTVDQYKYLLNPLKKARIAKRSQGGKQLSYLESWDVKAHLSRIFGFGNWDLEMLDYHHVATREYQSKDSKPMVEVIYACRMRLVVRDPEGRELARYSEGAVGSTSGPDYLLGDHHDNALKTAASDATKRCAINLGTQFGLSLYDNGNTNDVVRQTLVQPEGYEPPKAELTEEQKAALQQSLGATEVQAEAS
jgi:recombination DNA repair RAD52 pathway protein